MINALVFSSAKIEKKITPKEGRLTKYNHKIKKLLHLVLLFRPIDKSYRPNKKANSTIYSFLS